MNEHLAEKLPRRRVPTTSVDQPSVVRVLLLPQKLNQAVSCYYKQQPSPAASPAWTRQPDVPTSAEVQDLVVEGEDEHIVQLHPNLPTGAWESKDAYLNAHHDLLREDAIRPLRETVNQVRARPYAPEQDYDSKVGVYDKVRIIGYTASSRGFAVHISFSTKRSGKAINWAQTNRLMAGSLVALSPTTDGFSKKVVIATVAARPAADLVLNPPELDLFFARAEEVEIDPSIEWTIVEARGNLYEASKPVLAALKHMSHENSPMMEHLVSAQAQIKPPQYLQDNPHLDLTSVLINNKHQTYERVNVLTGWPADIQSELDASQLDALRRMLTNRLAIVQGPPGTGKTHVSVKALQVMLANRKQADPPIVVACQTNHAIDQILRHIAEFEPQFARLGGFSKDQGKIKERTLYMLRQAASKSNLPGGLSAAAYKRCRGTEKELVALLQPLDVCSTALDPHVLLTHNLLTEQQVTTLAAGSSRWVQTELITGSKTRSPFHVWLSSKLQPVPHKSEPEDHGFEFEEEDPELEQLEEAEAENGGNADDNVDFGLNGEKHKLADNFTCAKGSDADMRKVAHMLKTEQDLWKIPEALRGAIYRHLQDQLKAILTEAIRVKIKTFDAATSDCQIGRFEKDEIILRDQKLIGMTTTGLNKYRGLISALGCKIVLIEEAAETLEAPVLTACIPSLEHLILVGDHKQLRPHCQVKDHEDEPWWLNVSLFERMVNNDIGMTTLKKQRRMLPEIRRLLRPIYGSKLEDHHSVASREDIPGMGGINSWFFSHTALEVRNELSSFTNPEEASMIFGFVKYLVKNGVQAKQITIITFYKGQHFLLLRKFRNSGVVIATVDSYQGEENRVVILSTVRSNETKSVGFLTVDNRTCVALSRARDGFYIFGNSLILSTCPTWRKVIRIIAGQHREDERPAIEPKRFNDELPLRCKNHGTQTNISTSSDWTDNCGGCTEKCPGKLDCGHECPELCHPYEHSTINCLKACVKVLPCGHKCGTTCSKECNCPKCPKAKEPAKSKLSIRDSRSESSKSRSKQENGNPDLPSENTSPLRQEILIPDLIDLDESSTGMARMVISKEEANSSSSSSLLD